MIFFKFAKNIILLSYKNRQFILIDFLFFMIKVIPDKTTIFPVFCNGGISDNFPILINCIKIKNEKR